MIGQRTDLPRYNRPPVVEVAIGVQFRPMDDIKTAHYGVFWDAIREEYPDSEDQSPLVESVRAELLDTPPLRRVWFLSKDGKFLIQVQPDRFIHNWRKIPPDAVYPSFAVAKRMFYEGFERFRTFVKERGIGHLQLLKYEVTYVNHVVPDLASLPSGAEVYFPVFNWRSARSAHFLPDPKALSVNLSFPYGSDILNVSIRNGVRPDKQEILQIDFSARGPVATDGSELDARLEVGHERIVWAFTDLSTPDAHKLWERTK